MLSDGQNRALLFDFFGTLVEYQPDRTVLSYPATFQMAQTLGLTTSQEEFVASWDASTGRLEAESKRTLREFSMSDAATAFAEKVGLPLTAEQCDQLGRSFVQEWQRHIHPIEGAAAMLDRLSADWTIGVVSNTHDRDMVPRFLKRMELDHVVAAVVLSVVHGRCKPHPSIYTDALAVLSAQPSRAVFVGDSYSADFEGPEAVGIHAFLIDPSNRHGVAEDQRLTSVLDLETRLRVR